MIRLLTTGQVAEALQVSEWMVRKMCRTKRLRAKNIGTPKRHIWRIPETELDAA